MYHVSRRGFLSVGAFGILSMPQILQAQQENQAQHKSVINIFLAGGPPHQDMWDIKDDAPSEIRGDFNSISTNVAGIRIGECFPQIASMFDKFTAIRSVVGCKGSHDGYQCMSGWGRDDGIGSQKYPAIGSVASKILDPIDNAVPITIGLAEPTKHKPWSEVGSAGYLGDAYKAFQPNSDMIDDLILRIEQHRFSNRRNLLTTLGGINTVLNNNTNTFNEEAFNVLTSASLLDALDLSKEDPKIRERYGDGKPFKYQYDGAPTVNEHLLIARRLVEAGARSVSLSYGRWDSH